MYFIYSGCGELNCSWPCFQSKCTVTSLMHQRSVSEYQGAGLENQQVFQPDSAHHATWGVFWSKDHVQQQSYHASCSDKCYTVNHSNEKHYISSYSGCSHITGEKAGYKLRLEKHSCIACHIIVEQKSVQFKMQPTSVQNSNAS